MVHTLSTHIPNDGVTTLLLSIPKYLWFLSCHKSAKYPAHVIPNAVRNLKQLIHRFLATLEMTVAQ